MVAILLFHLAFLVAKREPAPLPPSGKRLADAAALALSLVLAAWIGFVGALWIAEENVPPPPMLVVEAVAR